MKVRAIAFATIALFACRKNEAAQPQPTPQPTPAPQEPPKPAPAEPTEADEMAKKLDPGKMTLQAPGTYRAKFVTSKGTFVVEVNRDWSPKGADRFYNLVKSGFYDNVRFFRVVKGFMVQFGISGTPSVNAKFREAHFPDDAVKQSNKRGFMTFATSGPDSRTTQVFINYIDNVRLDAMGFTPFGKIVSGMDVVDGLNGKYGEQPSQTQPRIQAEGNSFLDKEFPGLDFVKQAVIQ